MTNQVESNVVGSISKEEKVVKHNSKLKRFARGAKLSYKDKDFRKTTTTIAVVGGIVNGLVTYAVTRDVEESVKYGFKIGASSFVVGTTVYAVGNGVISAGSEDYLEYLEEEF